MWEEMGWDEKSWDEVRWDEVRKAQMRWDEMRWSVECEVQVWSVKSAVWSVRKVFAWRCIAPGSCAGHVLGQQPCNSFAQSTHARAWLAHGACKFYRWLSLRQLPPRLVRVLLVMHFCVWENQNVSDWGSPLLCLIAREWWEKVRIDNAVNNSLLVYWVARLMQKLGDIFLGVKLLSWMTVFFLWPLARLEAELDDPYHWLISSSRWWGLCAPSIWQL